MQQTPRPPLHHREDRCPQVDAPYPHRGSESDETEAGASLIPPALHEIGITRTIGTLTPPRSRDVPARHPVPLYDASGTNVTSGTRRGTPPAPLRVSNGTRELCMGTSSDNHLWHLLTRKTPNHLPRKHFKHTGLPLVELTTAAFRVRPSLWSSSSPLTIYLLPHYPHPLQM